jgi:hypothetical protein
MRTSGIRADRVTDPSIYEASIWIPLACEITFCMLNAEAELLAEQRIRALIVAQQLLAHTGLMKALGGGYRQSRD